MRRIQIRAVPVWSGSCQATTAPPSMPAPTWGPLAGPGGRIEASGLRLIAPSRDQRSPLRRATRMSAITSPGRSCTAVEKLFWLKLKVIAR